MADIISLEETIADEVADKLRGKLSGEAKKRAPKRATDNTEAYQLYLKGRYHLGKRTPDGMRQAIDFFQQAIDRDPNYALAYAGLADCYGALASPYGAAFKPRDVAPRAKAFALKALELNPSLAEAHASLAAAKMFYDWDFAGAENSFRRAIEINPDLVTCRMYYPVVLAVMKRFDEAVSEAKRNVDLDPLFIITGVVHALTLILSRRWEQSLDVIKKTVTLEPHFHLSQGYLGLIHSFLGHHDEGIMCLKTAISLAKVPLWLSVLGYAYGNAGRKEEALESLKELEALSSQMYVDPLAAGLVYLGLGDLKQFESALAQAFHERIGGCIFLGTIGMYDPVRSEPFFRDICHKIGLP